jgi:hypothetical protein
MNFLRGQSAGMTDLFDVGGIEIVAAPLGENTEVSAVQHHGNFLGHIKEKPPEPDPGGFPG